jgi:hypothetical protein
VVVPALGINGGYHGADITHTSPTKTLGKGLIRVITLRVIK